jgi:hypothetical protein
MRGFLALSLRIALPTTYGARDRAQAKLRESLREKPVEKPSVQ